jgi:hypothetical protein
MKLPSFASVVLSLLGIVIGGLVGFLAISRLVAFATRCADPTGNTCFDRHGFIALGIGMLFGLPIGATIGGWTGYHLVARPTPRSSALDDAA